MLMRTQSTSFYLLNFPLRTTTSTRRKRAFQIPRNCAPYGAGLSIWYLKAVVGLVAENGRPAPLFVSIRERRRGVGEDSLLTNKKIYFMAYYSPASTIHGDAPVNILSDDVCQIYNDTCGIKSRQLASRFWHQLVLVRRSAMQ